MMELYQFAISHFCEKVRWAMDFKQIKYKPIYLVPGPHMRVAKKLSGKTSVPILKDQGKVVSGSGNILTYLDDRYTRNLLTPVNAKEQAKAFEWEELLDEKIGVCIRQICYHYMLKDKKTIIPLMSYGGKWIDKGVLKMGFSKIEKVMRKHMRINDETVKEAKATLMDTLAKVDQQVRGSSFLVGDRFTRADLTAAALAAPLIMPKNYSAPKPSKVPQPLAEFADHIEGQVQWVHRFYDQFRLPSK